jgi:sugar-specific transcriptional regulator TrmB
MIEELKSIGLTDGEVNVYLTLLKLGPSTNSPIARHAELQSSTVYYCLNSLIEKGFVTYVIKNNRKNYISVDPENIKDIIEEKQKKLVENKERINKIIPELKKYKNQFEDRTTAEVFEGFNGFQTIFKQIRSELKKGEEYEAFVIEQELSDPEEVNILFINHNKELYKKGIKLRLLAPERLRSIFEKLYGESFLKKYQEIRYTKEVIPVGITIYRNKVVTHITEKEKPLSIKIKNNKLAQMYKSYFNHVWKQAKA